MSIGLLVSFLLSATSYKTVHEARPCIGVDQFHYYSLGAGTAGRATRHSFSGLLPTECRRRAGVSAASDRRPSPVSPLPPPPARSLWNAQSSSSSASSVAIGTMNVGRQLSDVTACTRPLIKIYFELRFNVPLHTKWVISGTTFQAVRSLA